MTKENPASLERRESKGKSGTQDKSVTATIIQHWVPPAITAAFGLIAGILLAAYNFNLASNRFFLEKQVATADSVATEFSGYVENWAILIRMRHKFDAMEKDPSKEEKAYFEKAVYNRSDAREKLFSALDSTYLYYGQKTSALVVDFRKWDDRQSALKIDKLPKIVEWRKWQIKILNELHKEITK